MTSPHLWAVLTMTGVAGTTCGRGGVTVSSGQCRVSCGLSSLQRLLRTYGSAAWKDKQCNNDKKKISINQSINQSINLSICFLEALAGSSAASAWTGLVLAAVSVLCFFESGAAGFGVVVLFFVSSLEVRATGLSLLCLFSAGRCGGGPTSSSSSSSSDGCGVCLGFLEKVIHSRIETFFSNLTQIFYWK